MSPLSPDLTRQGYRFIVVGLLQLLLDWLVFVFLTALGIPAATGNVMGRISGALLGFWLNGRITFAEAGKSRLGWRRFIRFLLLWVPMTLLSTLAVAAMAEAMGLRWAWLAKPLVEGILAIASFFLWRHVVYR